jgi:dTDP-4-dehydrorhamnose reductase
MKTTLVLGDGLLGSEIVKQTGWDFISRKKDGIDFRTSEYLYLLDEYDTIVNCIANTDTYSSDKEDHWSINYKGVVDLVDNLLFKQKLVHISTSYVYSNSIKWPTEEDVPVHNNSWYGYTKLLGDAYVQLKLTDYLLIRTIFKDEKKEYSTGYKDVLGNFDWTEKIASLIIKLIEKAATGTYNVGTEPKSMVELLRQKNSEIKGIFCPNPNMPKNTVMNISKMTDFLGE